MLCDNVINKFSLNFRTFTAVKQILVLNCTKVICKYGCVKKFTLTTSLDNHFLLFHAHISGIFLSSFVNKKIIFHYKCLFPLKILNIFIDNEISQTTFPKLYYGDCIWERAKYLPSPAIAEPRRKDFKSNILEGKEEKIN